MAFYESSDDQYLHYHQHIPDSNVIYYQDPNAMEIDNDSLDVNPMLTDGMRSSDQNWLPFEASDLNKSLAVFLVVGVLVAVALVGHQFFSSNHDTELDESNEGIGLRGHGVPSKYNHPRLIESDPNFGFASSPSARVHYSRKTRKPINENNPRNANQESSADSNGHKKLNQSKQEMKKSLQRGLPIFSRDSAFCILRPNDEQNLRNFLSKFPTACHSLIFWKLHFDGQYWSNMDSMKKFQNEFSISNAYVAIDSDNLLPENFNSLRDHLLGSQILNGIFITITRSNASSEELCNHIGNFSSVINIPLSVWNPESLKFNLDNSSTSASTEIIHFVEPESWKKSCESQSMITLLSDFDRKQESITLSDLKTYNLKIKQHGYNLVAIPLVTSPCGKLESQINLQRNCALVDHEVSVKTESSPAAVMTLHEFQVCGKNICKFVADLAKQTINS